MTKRVVVVSLGRILADQIRVEPGEACAVVQHVRAWLQESVAAEGDAIAALPPLDTLGLTAFGDFEVRGSRVLVTRRARPSAEVAAELASLLLRLVSSGRAELDGQAAVCAVLARRTLRGAASDADLYADSHEIASPDQLLAALAPLQPADPSAALSALFARWMRTTDPAHQPARGVTLEAPEVAPVTLPSAAPSQPVLSQPRLSAPGAVLRSSRRRRRHRSTTRRWLAMTAAALIVLMLGWATIARRQTGESSTTARRTPADPVDPVDRQGYTEAVVIPPAADAAAGDAPRRLLHAAVTGRVPYSPSFDPRTQGLVFHTGLEHTALLEAALSDDGQVTAVRTLREDGSRAFHAQVSPDGTQLAFDSDVAGPRGVYVARRDGSQPRRVSGDGTASVPTWSPDGRTIAFTRAEPGRPRVWNVWTVHLPTGRVRRETSHRVGQAWGASWFPDGRRIAYSVEDQLVVLDRETGRRRIWKSPMRNQLVRTPAVSPDGRRILFQVHRDGAWMLDLERGTMARVLGDRSAQEFAWAPDGQRVAYHSVRGGSWGIWLMNVGG